MGEFVKLSIERVFKSMLIKDCERKIIIEPPPKDHSEIACVLKIGYAEPRRGEFIRVYLTKQEAQDLGIEIVKSVTNAYKVNQGDNATQSN